jgi:3-hydroxyacyl-CoA dehydrogenase
MEIKNVCVLGAGLMGSGIAQVCAQAGFQVTMRDIEQRFIDAGMNTIKKAPGGDDCNSGQDQADPHS